MIPSASLSTGRCSARGHSILPLSSGQTESHETLSFRDHSGVAYRFAGFRNLPSHPALLIFYSVMLICTGGLTLRI